MSFSERASVAGFEEDRVSVRVKRLDTAASRTDAVLKEKRKQNPQKTIDEFWSDFQTKHPGQVYAVLPDNLYAKRAAAQAPKGVVPGHNAIACFADAVAICKDKVEKIGRECRRTNQKYKDAHFDIEIDFKDGTNYCLNGLLESEEEFAPGSVKRVEDMFENPRFYIDGAKAGDVKQGRDGDCWFMAALCTLSNMEGLLAKICVARDEAVGVYGFVFHRDGEWISTIIDDKLYLTKPDYDEASSERFRWDSLDRVNAEEEYRKTFQTGSRALYFAQCSDPNETWLPLLEKAYAKAHGDFASISGGFVGEAIEDLTGGVTTELFTTDILDKDKFWRDELMQVNKDFLFGCFTGVWGCGLGVRKGIQERHAYSVMKVVEMAGERLLLLRNPWGKTEWTGAWSDGSKEWTPLWMERLKHQFGDDGAFWISYKDLIQKFQHFDRTRLFGPDWTVTQQWASLSVPWSVDYHDTKFSLQIKKAGPVAIVLSQLDDRYFVGLKGQYRFELQFRIHKEGEKEYIVRSNGHYCMRRSVSTEVDLEPGRYSVLLKITATRDEDLPRVEDVVRETCKEKREKLLQIGLSYDLAHAKGRLMETAKERKEKEERKQKKREAKRRAIIEKLKANRKLEKAREKKMREKQKKRDKKIAGKARKREAKKASKAKKAKPNGLESQQAIPAKSEEDKPVERKTTEHRLEERESLKVLVGAESGAKGGSTSSHDGPATPDSTSNNDLNNVSKNTETKSGDDAPPADVSSDSSSDDLDFDSDLDTDFSDLEITSSTDEEARPRPARGPKSAGAGAPNPAQDQEKEDSFAKDPWNAVCTVSLRVYSKDKHLSVEVIRPNEDEDESALDIDDTAADAAAEPHAEEQ